jgi:hypothetical protein
MTSLRLDRLIDLDRRTNREHPHPSQAGYVANGECPTMGEIGPPARILFQRCQRMHDLVLPANVLKMSAQWSLSYFVVRTEALRYRLLSNISATKERPRLLPVLEGGGIRHGTGMKIAKLPRSRSLPMSGNPAAIKKVYLTSLALSWPTAFVRRAFAKVHQPENFDQKSS